MRNFKSQISNSKFTGGFTLIELLVVMMVLVVIGSIIATIIFTTLRSANKTNALTVTRQNGDYAISQMSKMIRASQTFNGVSVDGNTYTSDCTSLTVGPTTPTPTPPSYHYIKFTNFDNGATTFICSYGSPPTIASQSGTLPPFSLIDTTSVNLDACSISCSQATSIDNPTIGIQISLSQKNSNTLFENKASAIFQTSVTIRNTHR